MQDSAPRCAKGRPSDTGSIVGLLHLQPRPNVPNGQAARFDGFTNVNVISYLSSWIVTGDARASGGAGARATLSLTVADETNEFLLSLDTRRWQLRYPGQGIRIANDPVHRKLDVIVESPVFSTNEPAWFLQSDSVLHIQITGDS